jgi:hypothetical protein
MGSVAIITAYVFALRLISLPAAAEVPIAIAAPGETLVVTAHAVGAQVYECKSDSTGKLAWQFREPIATLLIDGKTVGRHYAGPTWEMSDGSAVSAKVSARARPELRQAISRSSNLKPPPGTAAENSTALSRSKDSTRTVASRKERVTRPAHSLAFPTAPTTLFTEKPVNHIELVNGGWIAQRQRSPTQETALSTSISIAGKPPFSGGKQRTESSGVPHDSADRSSGPQQSS